MQLDFAQKLLFNPSSFEVIPGESELCLPNSNCQPERLSRKALEMLHCWLSKALLKTSLAARLSAEWRVLINAVYLYDLLRLVHELPFLCLSITSAATLLLFHRLQPALQWSTLTLFGYLPNVERLVKKMAAPKGLHCVCQPLVSVHTLRALRALLPAAMCLARCNDTSQKRSAFKCLAGRQQASGLVALLRQATAYSRSARWQLPVRSPASLQHTGLPSAGRFGSEWLAVTD